jgi:exonuclease III|tara:strand:+ start:275 stop:478 length:204 start_codon:yes stop_codon:yes gene_type:complete
MALYKNVNGINVKMTEQEESAHLETQKKSTDDLNLEKQVQEIKKNNKTSAQNKLKALGLTDAEIEAL